MTAENQLASVCELGAEIARLRDTIVFCEGQILRKEIAIAQLLDRETEPEVRSQKSEIRPLAADLRPLAAEQSVVELLDQVRLQRNGDPFRVADLVHAAAAAWPAEEGRIRRGAYAAAQRLLASGQLKRVDGFKYRNT